MVYVSFTVLQPSSHFKKQVRSLAHFLRSARWDTEFLKTVFVPQLDEKQGG